MHIITQGDTPVAVLIEAKHTGNHAIKHAVAQVTDYFVAFDRMIIPPLVFILTENYVKVILYPIENSDKVALINGVVLPPFPLFKNGLPNMCTLGMVLILANYTQKMKDPILLPQWCTFLMSRGELRGKVVTQEQAELARIKEELEEQHKRRLEEKNLEIAK